jgi:hypothetical protein
MAGKQHYELASLLETSLGKKHWLEKRVSSGSASMPQAKLPLKA